MEEIDRFIRSLCYLLNEFSNGLTDKGWNYLILSYNMTLPLDYVDENPHLEWDWPKIFEMFPVDFDFIDRHISIFDNREKQFKLNPWTCMCMNNKILSYSFIEKYHHKITQMGWAWICRSYLVGPEFINKFAEGMWRGERFEMVFGELHWKYLSQSENLDYETIRKYKQEWDWFLLSKNKALIPKQKSDKEIIKFLIEMEDNINWNRLSQNPNLDADMACYFLFYVGNRPTYFNISNLYKQNLVNGNIISRLNRNQLNWEVLSQWVLLDIKFVDKYKCELDWRRVAMNRNLNPEIVDKYWSFLMIYDKELKDNRLVCDEVGCMIVEKLGSWRGANVFSPKKNKPKICDIDWISLPDDIAAERVLEITGLTKKYEPWFTLSISDDIPHEFIVNHKYLPWDTDALCRRKYNVNFKDRMVKSSATCQ